MARLAGINIPDNKHTAISLTYIYGIGRTAAQGICNSTGVNPDTRIQDLNEEDLDKLRQEVSRRIRSATGRTLAVRDLRREVELNKKRLLDLGCYRGIRHRRNLPVRGQNTKNNARTCKGPKRPIRK